MKRQLTGNKRFRAPVVPIDVEHKFEKTLAYMTEIIGTRILNQAIKKLDKRTVNKFADAQIGNYAKVFLGLAKKAKSKLLNQFSNERINKLIAEIYGKIDKANSKSFYSSIETKLGVSQQELLSTEGLREQINALKLESQQWLEKHRNDAIADYVNNALRNMTLGEGLDALINSHKSKMNEKKNQSKFVARQQLSTYNSLSTKLRADNVGIDSATWVTARDIRVRQSHIDRNGKEFKLDKGLYSSIDKKHILPGIDYGCRCDYDLIIP